MRAWPTSDLQPKTTTFSTIRVDEFLSGERNGQQGQGREAKVARNKTMCWTSIKRLSSPLGRPTWLRRAVRTYPLIGDRSVPCPGREIELSTALASSVSFNDEITEGPFCLPVSKTDPRALGCTHSWSCVCDGLRSIPYAYHAMKDQIYWLEETLLGIPP